MTRVQAPLVQILRAYWIRRVELAAAAGVDTKVIHRICQGEFASLKFGALARVAVALGVAPTDLVPALATESRGGLIHRRTR